MRLSKRQVIFLRILILITAASVIALNIKMALEGTINEIYDMDNAQVSVSPTILTEITTKSIREVCHCPTKKPWSSEDFQEANFTSNSRFPIAEGHALNESLINTTGLRRERKNFLTIGVPSIRRMNGYAYLLHTIASLVNETSEKEKEDVTIVVFLADWNSTYNDEVTTAIQITFMEYLNSGFLQVVRVSKEFYPEMVHLKRNFKDTLERVRWRAKQVADYSFLFMYSQNKSQYYLQIEDDVYCAPEFISKIKSFIFRNAKQQWTILEFSELGFIGKLFKTADLPRLASFMWMFYQEQPVDWLITYFREAMAQRQKILCKPTLFQHIGLNSSFDTSQQNKLQDRFFNAPTEKQFMDDPPGMVYSTMKEYSKQNKPNQVYGSGDDQFFWATNPKLGDTVAIVFNNPNRISKIYVKTGNTEHPRDILKNATIEVGSGAHAPATRYGDVTCQQSKVIGHVINGTSTIEAVMYKYKEPIKCLRIQLTSDQDNWIVFIQIGVNVYHDNYPS